MLLQFFFYIEGEFVGDIVGTLREDNFQGILFCDEVMDIDIEVLFEDVFSGSLVLEKIHLRGEVISEVEIALPFSEDGESGFDLELHRGGCALGGSI